MEEKEARRIMFQVLTAVSQLHSLGIVHRDIKPENLLFYDKRDCSKVLVADFGLSEYEEELSNYSPICGTTTFLAPEVCLTIYGFMWSSTFVFVIFVPLV